ncbi:MAG: prolipoprotein diacylglyceryl transferase family protein [Planctomycetota bacterium]
MHPYLYQSQGLCVPAYPFFYGLGVAVAGVVLAVLLRRDGYSLRRSASLFFLGALATVVGGQILYGVVRWSLVEDDIGGFLALVSGGQILYGSLLLVVPTIWLFTNLLRIRPSAAFDALAVGAALGLAIGRIGCLLGGCCHGRPCAAAWGVRYPKMIDVEGNTVGTEPFLQHLGAGLIPPSADFSLPVYPVPLYECIAALGVFAILLGLWRRQRLTGRLGAVLVVCYAPLRFGLEFLRVQEPVLIGLTLAQLLSIAIGTVAVWLCLGTARNHRRRTDLLEM